MEKKIGDRVEKGDVIAVLYTASEAKLERAEKYLQQCYELSVKKPDSLKLVVDIIY